MKSLKQLSNNFFLFTMLLLMVNLLTIDQLLAQDQGLKDAYQNYFTMGVAVSPRSLKDNPHSTLIIKNFNSITAENVMKMGPIHPEQNIYYWEDADLVANYARKNGLKIRGHNLCWHNQTPNWLFTNSSGEEISKEELLNRLRDHIFEVVGRYRGQIYAWDVVNEVIDDNPQKNYRESIWYKICGEDFIIKAFEYAHEADPDAALYYNDYNAINPDKRDRIITMLKKFKALGVPIHGMGIQAHWNIYDLKEKDIRDAIDRYAALGLKIQITELDLSIYKSENGRREKREDESEEFTSKLERAQLKKYKMIFEVFRDYKDTIDGVTFWNISDKRSWLDNFPVRGRKNYPLLFDQHLQPKKAFYEVTNFEPK